VDNLHVYTSHLISNEMNRLGFKRTAHPDCLSGIAPSDVLLV
jgi:hypothetical protein